MRVEGKPNGMLIDDSGNVVFLKTWWNTILSYGAEALSRHQNQVGDIEWDPVVDGSPTVYRRFYTDPRYPGTQYSDHEAFNVGSIVGIRAMLPDSIPIEDFQRILEIAGRYKGISPFGYRLGFGRFEVVEVTRVK